MAKTFLSVGKVTTESVNTDQLVWVLLPETVTPLVVSTYVRQVHPGAQVLLRPGSVRNLFKHHFVPRLNSTTDKSLFYRKKELDSLQLQIDTATGDAVKRAQIFVTFLATMRLIDRKLYPLVEKLRQKNALTSKDLSTLIDVVYTSLRKTAEATSAHKQKLRDYIQTGAYDQTTALWLGRFVNPVLGLLVQRDRLAEELSGLDLAEPVRDDVANERELRQAIEQIRAGGDCPAEVSGVALPDWLISIIGFAPQPRFFAVAGEAHQGLNKAGCLNFDRSKSLEDFGASAPSQIPLDELSRAVTAFDRTLSQLVMKFAAEDPAMKEMSQQHTINSGMLLRGLLGDGEAMRTMYPTYSTSIPNQAELSERLTAKTSAAVANGDLARVCAPHYGLSEDELHQGLTHVLNIQRNLLPLVPMEVHRLADAIETEARLRKTAAKLEAAGSRATNRQQAIQLDVTLRAQTTRQYGLSKTLKADFHVDPTKLFNVDNDLIDRLKAIFGDDLEIMKPVLAEYIERQNAAQQEPEAEAAASGDEAVNS